MRLFYLLFLLTLSLGAGAQTILSGTVKSQSGEPLIGASIFFKGTTSGTTTDLDGGFKLQLDASITNPTLVFSYIGYKTQEVIVGNRTVFDIVLEEDAQALKELVVIGYTTEEKGKIVGAVNTVSSEQISKLPVPSIDQALQGRAPGVVVSQNTGAPGEGVSIRIRGTGSINAGNDPLYIVDGVPTLDINTISPQDVQSISVLKDAGATSVYGARATNGVVIVTTKSGSSGSPKITINSQVGVQMPSRLIKMADTNEYVSIYNEAATNDNVGKPAFLHRPLIDNDLLTTLPNVDQIDAILQKGILQTHSVSVSGSEGKTDYFISGNYYDQQGIIKSSNYNRLSSRINLSTQVSKWLKVGTNLNLTRSTTNLIGSSGDGAGGNGGSVIRYAFFRSPAIPIYDVNGDFVDKPNNFNFFGDGYNPVGMLAYNNNNKNSDRLFGKFFIELTPFKDFKFTSNLGIDFTSSTQKRFDRNWGTLGRINNPNQLTVADQRIKGLTSSNFITYNRSVGSSNFKFLLGIESVQNQQYGIMASQKNFSDQSNNLVFLGIGSGLVQSTENVTNNDLLSFFTKVGYEYKEKYLVSGTARRDGSSRFGPANRWGTFYSGSLGWRLDKEKFLNESNFIDLLLVRIGYGEIGNQEISDYAFTDKIRPMYNYQLGSGNVGGYAVSELGNEQLKWESSNQLNGGIDIQILNGKLAASIDYFKKVTYDLLANLSIPSSNGAALPPIANNGRVLNRGIEISLTYNDDIGDLHYSISGNAATLHNEVLQIYSPIYQGYIGSASTTQTEVGYPIGSFYMYEMEGIFQNTSEIFTHAYQGNNIKPGDVKFKDQDGNGVIDGNDRKHVGSAIPKITAGLNINLGYHNWDMSVFFQGAYGQKIFSVLNRDIEGFYRPFNVTQRYYDNRWTGPGTSNEFPRASWDASSNNAQFSTRFLEDGSYTRLKNLQIGYTLPKSITNRYGFGSFRIYFSGTNLLTFTRYSGLDPEMTTSDNATGQGDKARGLDWGTYPSAKSYNLGVNLTF